MGTLGGESEIISSHKAHGVRHELCDSTPTRQVSCFLTRTKKICSSRKSILVAISGFSEFLSDSII